jgi:hypothetical protein
MNRRPLFKIVMIAISYGVNIESPDAEERELSGTG